MKLTDHFLSQLERETPATRKALERVPVVGRNDWKPHEKSMTLGSLAGLVAAMPSWVSMVIEQDELDIGGGGQAVPKTSRELLEVFDKSVAAARRSLQNTTDEHLMTRWRLLYSGRVLSDTSRYVMLTDGVLSHLAHHRGQLTVYLRLNDVPVPMIYGATADEGR